ncbi:alpha/beta-hydrolase [Piromyces finnis]|uniref:Pheromone-processing carboxypeptidase KEX1 n=1 Tax=Piromyces finnis TaxID=1754191 RepID=A0A1Y1UY59_9FUNG|nr:alpha/beta-hydrolase [Piromyces finnis]|eukprot:ORX43278.1 alpha/beta-hydrolase [Piromyces finnis]
MNFKFLYTAIAVLASFVRAQNQLPDVPKAEELKVDSLPDISTLNSTQYAGLLPIRTNTFVFFWLFEQEEPKKPNIKEKLTVWLNGGSMDGVFMENGPYTFDEDGKITHNPYSWNKHTNVVYVDQPTGTGFSYTKNNDIPRNEYDVGRDFNTFLGQLFRVFPQYADAEIYIAGESFAGTYIPYIASNLIKNPVNEKMIDLQGIAIGNGWIDPARQYQGYLKYSVDNNILSGNALKKVKELTNKCTEEYKKKDRIKNYGCEYILDSILDGTTANGQFCINMYDIRLRDTDKKGGCGLYSWPLTLGSMTYYLQRLDVIEAIHASATPHTWRECTSRVSSALSGDNSKPSYTLFPFLLEHIKITLFAGDKDLICNHAGIEMMIDNMTWDGAKGYSNGLIDWVVNGKVSGAYQSERNLTYIRMTNGSHMVPIDLPEESLFMFNSFIGINDEEKASLDNQFDYDEGQKKLSSDASMEHSNSNVTKLLSLSILSVSLIAFVTVFAIRKNKQNDATSSVEWHELMKDNNGSEIEDDNNDNVIDINLDDDEESLSDIENFILENENDDIDENINDTLGL